MIITIRTDEYIHCAVCNVQVWKIFIFLLLCDTDTPKQQWMLICFINIETSMHNTDWMQKFAQNTSNKAECNSSHTCLSLSNSNGSNDQLIMQSYARSRISILFHYCDIFGSILCLIMLSDSQSHQASPDWYFKTQCLRHRKKCDCLLMIAPFFVVILKLWWLTLRAIFIKTKYFLLFMLSYFSILFCLKIEWREKNESEWA